MRYYAKREGEKIVRMFIFTLVLGFFIQPGYLFALGLGDIQVNSMLNQQLDARIPILSAAPEDAEVIILNLASREQFLKSGIDRPHSLKALKFRSFVEDGNVYIKITTSTPIREPSLHFLMEVDWPQGRLLREYTVLLEPPTFMGQKRKQSNSTSLPIKRVEKIDTPSSAVKDGFRPTMQY